jgi:hypothetical protein
LGYWKVKRLHMQGKKIWPFKESFIYWSVWESIEGDLWWGGHLKVHGEVWILYVGVLFYVMVLSVSKIV